jgi:L-fuconolactonase
VLRIERARRDADPGGRLTVAPRIDAHQHFWRYSPQTHAWIDGTMLAIKRDFLPPDLKPLLDAAGFDGCIAVQAEPNIAETEWLLRLAGEHPFIRGVVGWVDLCAPDVTEQLRSVAAHPRLRGIRHIVQDEPEGFMLRPDFQRGIAALAEFGLTYDILIYERQLPEALALVRRFPNQRFVIDHIAKPAIRDASIDAWRNGITAITACPNVYCKLSGMVTEADWQRWRPIDFAPYIETVLEAFGPRRVMIGSDWPVCLLAGEYGDVMAIVTDAIGALSVGERDAILGGTAAEFYGVA